MRTQFVRDRFAHQPRGIVGEPAIGGFRLVQFQLFLEQVAQPVEQLALQRALGAAMARAGSPPSSWATEARSACTTSSPSTPACSYRPARDVEQWCPRDG